MIEILIKYIQDKGYTVDVYPQMLIIRKEAKNQIFQIAWGIFKDDLCPELEQYLYDVADRKLWEIEQAIANYSPLD